MRGSRVKPVRCVRGSFRCWVQLDDIKNIFGIIAVCSEKLQVPGTALNNEHVLHTSVVASTRTVVICDFVGGQCDRALGWDIFSWYGSLVLMCMTHVRMTEMSLST